MPETAIFAILNGLSSRSYLQQEFPGPVYGCNRLCEDRSLAVCVAVDRLCVKHLRETTHHTVGEFWTLQRPLDLPPGWQHRQFRGVDSGSACLEIALERAPTVFVIGADGILGGNTVTSYQYPWHPHGTRPGRHSRFRSTVLELHHQHPERLQFVWDLADPVLNTIHSSEFNKYLHGQTPSNT